MSARTQLTFLVLLLLALAGGLLFWFLQSRHASARRALPSVPNVSAAGAVEDPSAPRPSPEVAATLTRIRGFGAGGRMNWLGLESQYEKPMGACLQTLSKEAARNPGALLTAYRDLCSGDSTQNRREDTLRAALLHALAHSGDQTAAAEVGRHLLGALQDPVHPDNRVLEFLVYAFRRNPDPATEVLLRNQSLDLGPGQREAALSALANRPLPEDLPMLEGLWNRRQMGEKLYGPLSEALAGLPDGKGLPLLADVVRAPGNAHLSAAIAQVGTPAAAEVLIRACAPGETVNLRSSSLRDLAEMLGLAIHPEAQYDTHMQSGLLGEAVTREIMLDWEPAFRARRLEDPKACRACVQKLEELAVPGDDPAVLVPLCGFLMRAKSPTFPAVLQRLETHRDPRVRLAVKDARDYLRAHPN